MGWGAYGRRDYLHPTWKIESLTLETNKYTHLVLQRRTVHLVLIGRRIYGLAVTKILGLMYGHFLENLRGRQKHQTFAKTDPYSDILTADNLKECLFWSIGAKSKERQESHLSISFYSYHYQRTFGVFFLMFQHLAADVILSEGTLHPELN